MNKIVNHLESIYRKVYESDDFIPLHAPVFRGNEKKYLNECIESTFVSSVGKYVDRFQEELIVATLHDFVCAMNTYQ